MSRYPAAPPIKMVGFLDRRRDLDLAAFSEHWRTIHRVHALKLIAPGIMRGYVQNHRKDPPIPGLSPPGDGAAELWTDRVEDVFRLPAAPEYLQGAYLDEPAFMEGRSRGFIATERVFIDGDWREALGGVKAMLFFKRAKDLGQPAFDEGSNAAPGSLLMPSAQPFRLTRHSAIEDARNDWTRQIFDGAEFSWWPDLSAFHSAWAQRSWHRLIEPTATQGMLVSEEPVLWPGHTDPEPPPRPRS